MPSEDHNLRNARICLNADGHGTMHIGDVDFSNAIDGLHFSSRVGDTPRLELSFVAPSVGIKGDMAVIVPDATSDALMSIGWTPPPG